ncbi:co-chaperone YbbN [Sinimarinibacterium sp. NLF-5-8]|uniref:thioredoxin family protein n=1 Tax=Sinimarinibacterium sp. NLF-5-8 TaxID=2698684 RepID=UPI00137BA940|nr:thioredoxin family protein [Sinimarinibacterium sp. NLF-5-8]QHS11303.1 thioredoxin family protein [Sinimarinibacterium sp. NLF-5-8]
MMIKPIPSLDSAALQQQLHSPLPTLVLYTRDHCIWCDRQLPLLERLAMQRRDSLHVVQVNLQQNPEATLSADVRTTPCLALFRDGRLLMLKAGLQRPQALEVFVDYYLSEGALSLVS